MTDNYKHYIEDILKARVYDVAEVTPYELAPKLSQRLHNKIFLKREDLQPTFSFKLRGAFNKISSLSEEERKKGIIAASAGNHAQGVALAAKHFGAYARIIMPDTASQIKVDAVKAIGADVILEGATYQDAENLAKKQAQEEGLTFVHAFDDPKVIAGQGTIALELIRQANPMPDIIFVCVGGGGLIAGIAVLIKQLYPEVKIIGVEHKDAPTHAEARKAGKPVDLPYVGAFADGAAVKRAGKETFAIASKYVDEFILVDTDSICAAIKAVFEDTRTILEPAGALSVAGIEAYVAREHCKNLTFAAITSGANINFARLRHVAERAELGAEREAVFAIKIPERPGSFKEFCEMLGKHSITEFNYRYFDPSEAQIFVGISIDGLKQKEALAKVFKKKNFEAIDLSHNEIAKNHVRYMVGGRNPLIADEKIFSFRFPERPGALMRFLVSLPKKWNISLFHYRNHGSDIGRVLAGIQIPPEDAETYQEQLRSIGYSFREQTDNPVCQLFL